jgi:predicted alpha-1,2-mannosidase
MDFKKKIMKMCFGFKNGEQFSCFGISIFMLLCICGNSKIAAQSILQYVQPLSGSAPATTKAALMHSEAGSELNANTIPSVTLPFAMTQWTPQTRLTETKCQPPYYYADSVFSGFRGTHWLSGSCTQDYGSFTIMPVTGKLKTASGDYAVPFSHSSEITSPAYYQLNIPAYHLITEMTSTLRCGMMQFTMEQDDSLYLLVMPNSDKGMGFVKIDPVKGEIWGYNPVYRIYQGWGEPAGFNGWFCIKIEKKMARSGTYAGKTVYSTDSIFNQKDIGAFAGFYLKKGETLTLRIGTSFSSLAGARLNLDHEIASKNFKEIAAISTTVWEKGLARIRVTSKDEQQKKIFYTAFYHAMQMPRRMNDVDGNHPLFGKQYQFKKLAAGNYYDDFSMWDIYRAQLPLFEILDPELINQLVASIIEKGKQGGWLPIFPCWNNYTAAMIGDHAAAFIASAYTKGIRHYDVQEAYRLMRKNAFETADFSNYKNGMGRRALVSYLKYGYIPMEDSVPEAFHKKEQVSRTLEYAFDDYAVSVVAKDLGKKEDYQILYQRSINYRNVFDTSVGMVRGKHTNGKWVKPFNADNREVYITEGTPRQYSFFVPQDIPGLTRLMGGEKGLERTLDSLFAKNEYWHGNEPGHQIPFMYNYTAAPYKTQAQVRKILGEEYSDGPGGLSGNDDAGQMSAWYLFAAIGFYPVNPVSNQYQLCSPLFDTISIVLPQHRNLTIICSKKTKDALYIQQVKWNGNPYEKNYINYEDLMKGGKLEFTLVGTATDWGSQLKNRAGNQPF